MNAQGSVKEGRRDRWKEGKVEQKGKEKKRENLIKGMIIENKTTGLYI